MEIPSWLPMADPMADATDDAAWECEEIHAVHTQCFILYMEPSDHVRLVVTAECRSLEQALTCSFPISRWS